MIWMVSRDRLGHALERPGSADRLPVCVWTLAGLPTAPVWCADAFGDDVARVARDESGAVTPTIYDSRSS